jgi:hypothetical protein
VTGTQPEARISVSPMDNSGNWTGTGTEPLTSVLIRRIHSEHRGGHRYSETGPVMGRPR